MSLWLKQSTAATLLLGPFVDDTDFKTPKTALSIVQADVRVSKNGGAFAQKNDASAATHRENGVYAVPIDATDTNTLGAIRFLVFKTSALVVWQDFLVLPANVYDSLVAASDKLQIDLTEWKGATPNDLIAARVDANAQVVGDKTGYSILDGDKDVLVDKVWDEVLTAATHNVPASSGRRLRQIAGSVLRDGTAQGGGANFIDLDSGASSVNNLYAGEIVAIVGGTGEGQARLIVAYDGGVNKRAHVQRTWVTNPDGTSEFIILGTSMPLRVDDGVAQAGAAGSITLAASAPGTNDVLNGMKVVIMSGTGLGQGRIITAYNGTTKVATIAPDWTVNPDTTSVYVVFPLGRSQVDIWRGALANVLIAGRVDANAQVVGDKTGYVLSAAGVQAIWDALTSALTTVGSIGKKLADWALGSDNRVLVSADAHTAGVTVAAVTGNLGGNVNGNVVGDVQGKVLGGGVGVLTGTGVRADLREWKGATPNDLATGRVDAKVGAMDTDVVSAAAISAAAVEKILRAVGGTATASTTTTFDDPGRTEADVDYWKDAIVVFTAGPAVHQPRRISAFDPTNDRVTVDTPFTTAPGLNTYIILRTAMQQAGAGSGDWTVGERAQIRDALGVDGTKTAATGGQVQGIKTKTDQLIFSTPNQVDARVQSWKGATPNDLIAGRVDANAQVVGDKSGYALSAAGVQAIWDALTSALTAAGSIGKKLADWALGTDNRVLVSANAHTSGETVAAVSGDVQGKVLGGGVGAITGVGARADLREWKGATPNDLIAGRVDANAQVVGDKTGYALSGAAEDSIVAKVWAAASRTLTSFGTLIADIWAHSTRTLTAFSTALAVSIWDVLESAITTASSIGVKVKNNLDTTVSSRAPETGGNLAAVRAQTDQLAFTTGRVHADVKALDGSVAAAQAQRTAVDTIYLGTVTGASTPTTIVDSGLTELDVNFWTGRIVIFVTGALRRQATDISGFDPSTDRLTVTALTQSPQIGDTYVIV